ncbi:MAG: hypothetical protein J7L07_03205 [Candidatus Odinarchaeota archaeon]|nr:hypothetical protein [Candidatus Odinarchaeota archaeon]
MLTRYKGYLLSSIDLEVHKDFLRLPIEKSLKSWFFAFVGVVIIIFTYAVWHITNGFKLIIDFLVVSLINLIIMILMIISSAIITMLNFTDTKYIVFFEHDILFVGKNWILKLPKNLIKEFYLVKSIGMRVGLVGVTLFYTLRVNINNKEYNLWHNYTLPQNIVEVISKHIPIRGVKRYHYKHYFDEYWADISEIVE